MAIITRGILGGFKGKVANVVGSSWKGRAVMKSLPLSVANPRTVGQVNQRNKFSFVTAIASQLLISWVRPLWNPFAGYVSGYNKFRSVNTPLMIGTPIIDLGAIKYSVGGITSMAQNDCELAINIGDTEAIAVWNEDIYGTQLATDKIYVAVLDASTGEVLAVSAGVSSRADLQAVLTLPSPVVGGQVLRAVFSAKRANGTDVADSISITHNLV